MVAAEAAERFRADFVALGRWALPLPVAVSGGADSLALLLLASAAFPGQVLAATVDHGLRPAGAEEARRVAEICAAIGVPHAILDPTWVDVPQSNLQARARAARYRVLRLWALEHDRRWIATAHHVDDQAETLLMRLNRGAGLAGLAGVRPKSFIHTTDGPVLALRPLLGWRKAELGAVVDASPFTAVEDPSNDDARFDRTRVRRLLGDRRWLRPERIAASAGHLSDCEEALEWAARQVRPVWINDDVAEIDAQNLPWEIQRRVLRNMLTLHGSLPEIPGPKLARLLAQLNAGSGGTLAGTIVRPGPPWRFEPAPPHRS